MCSCVIVVYKSRERHAVQSVLSIHPKRKRKKERKRQIKSILSIDFSCGAMLSTEKKKTGIASTIRLHHSLNDTKTHLAVRVLLYEENGHVGGDKASPAGD